MAGSRERPRAPNQSPSSDRELVITRVFDAPRQLVWQAWTDPKHVSAWWGPRGFTTRVPELDLCTGGRWSYVMVGPDGAEHPCHGVFREIVPGERIITSDEFGEGHKHPRTSDLPTGIVLDCHFEAMGEKTRLTLRIIHPTAESRRKHEEMGVIPGWSSSLDCLDEHLADLVEHIRNYATLTTPSDREIVIRRVFDAPRSLVFDCWTKPEHIRHWWGLRDHNLTVCDVDLRPGGAWRYVLSDPDGQEYGFSGVYREIKAPEKLVHTYVFEMMPDHGAIFTVTFEERDGKTTMTETILHQSKEDRDGHVQSGMEAGMRVTLERLAELLRRIQRKEQKA